MSVKDKELYEYLLGGCSTARRVEIARAIEATEALQARVRQLEAELEPLSPPDVVQMPHETRQSVVQEAMRQARLATPPARQGLRWRWLLLPATVAAAAAVILMLAIPADPHFTLQEGSAAYGDSTLTTGESLPLDQELVLESGARVTMAGDVSLRASRRSRLRLARLSRKAVAWRLREGRVAMQVRPKRRRTVAVETSEMRVEVLGTSFAMERDEVGRSTRLSVEAGRVAWRDLVRNTSGTAEAGEEVVASLAEPDPEVEPVPEPAPPPATEEESESGQPSVAGIRKKIRNGRSQEARQLINKARQQTRRKSTLAELLILEAEADLEEQSYRSALRSYLLVGKRFPRQRQAESALFAAGQLALDHPGLGQDGRGLLRRYLAKYPRGRFVLEAERLLAE